MRQPSPSKTSTPGKPAELDSSEKGSAEDEAALLHAQVEIGLKILLARRRQKLTQADLAERGKFRQATVFQAEAGIQNMTLRTLVRLSRALNVPLRELMPHTTTMGEAAGGALTSLVALETASDEIDKAQEIIQKVREILSKGYENLQDPEKP